MIYIYILKYRHIQSDTLGNISFYMPYLLFDDIQNDIVFKDRFHEIGGLEELDTYIPDNAIILDIGANIGTHSIYWGVVRHAEKIIAFEPMKDVFNTLSENIKLNELQDTITLYNIGLGARSSLGSCAYKRPDTSLLTAIKEDPSGDLTIEALDNIDLQVDRIDFIKIDVEGHELEVLKGAIKTIEKYKPILSIEIFTEHSIIPIKGNFNEERRKAVLGDTREFLTQKFNTIVDILTKSGYIIEKEMEFEFIFVHKDKINK